MIKELLTPIQVIKQEKEVVHIFKRSRQFFEANINILSRKINVEILKIGAIYFPVLLLEEE